MKGFPLSADLVSSMLQIPDDEGAEKLNSCLKKILAAPITLKDRFELTRQLFSDSLEEVRAVLASNALTPVIAKAEAKKEGLYGKVDIEVSDSGVFLLSSNGRSSTREGRKQTNLNKLRQEAAALGIEVSALGRSKKALLEAVQKSHEIPEVEVKTPEVAAKPLKQKRVKQEKRNLLEGPGAEELLEGLFGPEPEKPLEQEKPTAKAMPLPKMSMLEVAESKPNRKNLKALMQDSDSVDLDQLLSAASPESKV